MAQLTFRTNDQKAFAKDFDVLCRTRPRWQAWSDFIHMTAYAISNTVDEVHRQEREEAYSRIAEQYSKAEREAVARLLTLTVSSLEEDPDQDFLGDLYMRLNLGNEHAGQFFTPYDVGKMMAQTQAEAAIKTVERDGFASVCDCCVGGGCLLVAFANACREKKLNFQQHVLFVGQDLDHTVGAMAYIQLSLLGCPGYIVIGNSLTEPLTGDVLFPPMEREVFVTPMFCTDVWMMRRAFRSLGATAPATRKKEPTTEEQEHEQPTAPAVPIQLSLFDL